MKRIKNINVFCLKRAMNMQIVVAHFSHTIIRAFAIHLSDLVKSEKMNNLLKFCSLEFLTKWHMQTVQTKIRLFLQSDQDLHCLPNH